MLNENITEGLEVLLQDIVSKYNAFTNQLSTDSGGERVKAFEEGLSISVGRKYAKIMSNGSVWGFVVNTESDKKFSLGDILYPAGWATPSRNKARGNVITQEWGVSWTGPNYLK